MSEIINVQTVQFYMSTQAKMWIPLEQMDRLSSPSVWNVNGLNDVDAGLPVQRVRPRRPPRPPPPPLPHRNGMSFSNFDSKPLPKEPKKKGKLWRRVLHCKRLVFGFFN